MISQGQQTMTVHSSLIAFIKWKVSTAAFLLILQAYTVLVDRTGDGVTTQQSPVYISTGDIISCGFLL